MPRILNFTDLHGVLVHPGYFNWLIKQIEDFKPDYLVDTGDRVEGKPGKQWAKYPDERWTALDELRTLSEQTRALNDAAPNAKKIWIHGNHDEMLFGSLPARIPEDLQSLTDWRNLRGTEPLEQWTIHEKYTHRFKVQLGQITFQHGCDVSKSPERAMKDAAYQYAVPYGLYVCGHGHKPVPVTQCEERAIALPYWIANAGTGADWDRMHYMDRCSNHKWGRGVVKIECTEASIRDSKTAYTKPQWQAELVIHSTARD